MKEPEINILIVEDEALIAQHLKYVLESFGYNISATVYKFQKAIEAIDTIAFDILITDINLGNGLDEKSGLQVAHYVNETKKCPIIFLTAFNDIDTIKKASALKPSAYLVKPVNDANLFATVQIAFENYKATKHANIEQSPDLAIDYFYTKIGVKLVRINWKEVYLFEAMKNYVHVSTPMYPKGVLLRGSLQGVIDNMIPNAIMSNFIRISRSTLLRKDIILKVIDDTVVTTHGEFKCNAGFTLDP